MQLLMKISPCYMITNQSNFCSNAVFTADRCFTSLHCHVAMWILLHSSKSWTNRTRKFWALCANIWARKYSVSLEYNVQSVNNIRISNIPFRFWNIIYFCPLYFVSHLPVITVLPSYEGAPKALRIWYLVCKTEHEWNEKFHKAYSVFKGNSCSACQHPPPPKTFLL
jgi:hypothetical protein